MKHYSALILVLVLLLASLPSCSNTKQPDDTPESKDSAVLHNSSATEHTEIPPEVTEPTTPEITLPDLEETLFLGQIGDGEDALFHHVNGNGEILLETHTVDSLYAKNGLAVVTSEDDLVGFVDKDGLFAIEPQFEDAGPFSNNGLAPVQANGKWGFINEEGKIVISCEYAGVSAFNESGYAIVYASNLTGIIDSEGNLRCPLGEYNNLMLADEYYIIETTILEEYFNEDLGIYEQFPRTIGYEIRNYSNNTIAQIDVSKEPAELGCIHGDIYKMDKDNTFYHFVDGKFIKLSDEFGYSFEGTETSATASGYGYRIIHNGIALSSHEYDEVCHVPGSPFILACRYQDKDGKSYTTDIFDLRTGTKTAENIPYAFEMYDAYISPDYFVFENEESNCGVIDYTGKVIMEPIYWSLDTHEEYATDLYFKRY